MAHDHAAVERLVFDGSLARGNDNYRAYRGAWVGRPAGRPSVVRRGGSLYASWNGATEITSGRSMTGRRIARTGFETRMPRGSKVRALDAAGNVLGETAPRR